MLLEAVDLAAPPAEVERDGIRRILVAFDGTPESWAALRHAIDVAVRHSALLTVAAVVPELRLVTGFGPLVLPYSPEALRRDAEREVQRLLAAARDEVPANVSLTTQLLHGRTCRAIAACAKAGGYDLVITGPRPGRLRRLLEAA